MIFSCHFDFFLLVSKDVEHFFICLLFIPIFSSMCLFKSWLIWLLDCLYFYYWVVIALCMVWIHALGQVCMDDMSVRLWFAIIFSKWHMLQTIVLKFYETEFPNCFYYIFMFACLCFCGGRDQTQGVIHARQVFSHTPSPFQP